MPCFSCIGFLGERWTQYREAHSGCDQASRCASRCCQLFTAFCGYFGRNCAAHTQSTIQTVGDQTAVGAAETGRSCSFFGTLLVERTGTMGAALGDSTKHFAILISDGTTSGMQRVAYGANSLGGDIVTGVRNLGGMIKRAAISLYNWLFEQKNWRSIVTYLVAWGIIIICSGALYGFQKTAFPFAIGMGFGATFGIMTGVVMVKAVLPHVDPHDRWRDKNTIWGFINTKSQKLDFTTRTIALTICVSLFLMLATKYPHGLGGVAGAVIGNHIATKYGMGQNMGRSPGSLSDEQQLASQRIQTAGLQLDEIERRRLLLVEDARARELHQIVVTEIAALNIQLGLIAGNEELNRTFAALRQRFTNTFSEMYQPQ
ncbi:MAG: hypothetical protein ACKVOH_05425 [Chlamydiales bacterium]